MTEQAGQSLEDRLIQEAKGRFVSDVKKVFQAANESLQIDGDEVVELFLSHAWQLIDVGEVNAGRRFLREVAADYFAHSAVTNADDRANDAAGFFRYVAEVPGLEEHEFKDFLTEEEEPPERTM